MNNHKTNLRNSEQGTALIVSLLLMTTLSLLGATMMFLAQTETASSINYRLMSQARYGAESGVHAATNFLLNNGTYVKPSTGGADPMNNYITTVSPVTYNGNPVVLSANAAVPSNYPIAAVRTAFAAIAGTVAAGNGTVQYAPYATLLSMEEIQAAVSIDGLPHTIQTWQVTSGGTIAGGARTAQVEVSAVIDTQKTASNSQSVNYGAFAMASICGALNWGGSGGTDSYTYNAATHAFTYANGGNVGTNGNLTDGGNSVIHGSLSSPRSGVGACSAGNVDAQTSSGNSTVTGGIIHLSQPVVLPPPNIPPAGATDINPPNHSTVLASATPPGSYRDVNISTHSTLHLAAGTYNINSITMESQGELVIDSGPVILNVTGGGSFAAMPIDFSSGSLTEGVVAFDSSKLQINYAGTGLIKITGGAATTAVVYAPRAAATLTGGGDFYGEIIANTIADTGGATIHYDSNLANRGLFVTVLYTPGNPMLSSFTWKKY
jgi:Tfp pilus assembly protein PilX